MSVFFFDIRKKYTSYTEEIYVKKNGIYGRNIRI